MGVKKSMRRILSGLVVLAIFYCGPLHAADKYESLRNQMVEQQLIARGVEDGKVIAAMRKVPRHLFVGASNRAQAYNDYPLPIGEGQTISQPYIVAMMTEALGLKPTDRVLEIGTGSGYQAAILAELVKDVYTIEIREGLAKSADRRLSEMGYKDVKVKHADGYFGWEEHAPFDAIIITAAPNHIPSPLLRQLKEGGRLIVPLGRLTFYQVLTLARKVKGEVRLEQITEVSFVPMTGEAERRK